MEAYGLNGGTNFQDPHHTEVDPSNVIYLTKHPTKLVEEFEKPIEDINADLAQVNAVLLAARTLRKQARLDDKTIVAWNGLMITGMAETGRVTGNAKFIEAAERAFGYIETRMRADETGHLYRSGRAGKNSPQPAFAEDYAMLMQALIALHRATDKQSYLEHADLLVDETRTLFWDEKQGGYFDTLANRDDLFVRSRNSYDGAVPAANSVMLHNLLDLYELMGEERFLDEALAVLRSVSAAIRENPISASNSTRGLQRLLELAPARVATLVPSAPVAEVSEVLDDGMVKISASTGELVIGEAMGASTTLMVTLEIGDGFHVNAHEPGDALLQGLTIRLEDGGGVIAAVVAYPAGDVYTLGDQAINVHTGTVQVAVELTRQAAGALVTSPTLVVAYQVCDDSVCFAPAEVTLPIEIK